jgi:class 3 adenylate cyclase
VLACGYCHHLNAPDSRFCGHCGARLVAATERRDERKLISVLFADLVGFTSRAERMDVEDVQGMLDPYYGLVREELEKRGGVVEKFIGDAVVAVFGVPVSHEDDAERAVRAALAIRDALAAFNERDPALDLHVRVAVTTGEALVAVDVSPHTGETFASGDVVNTAARLQAAAPVDGVVVGEAAYRATSHAIEYEPAAPVVAKGKAAPIACWKARRPRSRVGAGEQRPDAAALVDRHHERGGMLAAFEQAVLGRSVRSLTLLGDPGIGKSRLVGELFRHIDAQPELIRWREGRSPPYGRGMTFSALGEIVKAEAGLLESHALDAASAKLADAVAAVAPDRDEAAWLERHLRTLVGLDAAAALFDDRRAEAFAAWRRFIERLAEHRPTVLVFEDVHWADDALVDFIEHLDAWAADIPLLVVCTARPELLERRPGWSREAGGDRVIHLAPLSESDTEQLLVALLGDEGLPPATRSALLARAEGNPLYAQELVRMLVDRGILVERDGAWILEDTDDLPVPDSVLGIITARLDAVPAEDRDVIQAAAVVGRGFWLDAVACVADRSRADVEAALGRLEQRHLVLRRPESLVAGDAEYLFEHGLIRDVAYRSILRARRSEQHARAAVWLASLTGDARDRADTIAHHWLTALENAEAARQPTVELRAAASEALHAAAERAGSLQAHATAAELWARALELFDPADPRRPRVLLAYGTALAIADEPADAVLSEASRALLDAGDRTGAAEAESTRAWLHSLAGTSVAARACDEVALELVADAPDSQAKALILTRSAAHVMFRRERQDAALRLLREAIAIARRQGLREIEAEALQFVGMARLDAGEEDGIREIQTALAVATELNSAVSLSCYGNLADMHRYLGELSEAATLHRDGANAATRFGIPVQVRRFGAGRGCDLYYAGDWDGALTRIDEYLAAVEGGSPHRMAGELLVYRGRIRLARGDGAGALADARAALAFARRTAEPFDLLPALAFHARATLPTAPDQARASAAELVAALAAGQPFWGAWALSDALPALGGHPEVARLLEQARPRARWYDAAGAILEGDFDRAAGLYAAIGSRPDEAAARLAAARRHAAAGDEHAARRELEPAVAFFTGVRAHALLDDAPRVPGGPLRPAAAPSPRSGR